MRNNRQILRENIVIRPNSPNGDEPLFYIIPGESKDKEANKIYRGIRFTNKAKGCPDSALSQDDLKAIKQQCPEVIYQQTPASLLFLRYFINIEDFENENHDTVYDIINRLVNAINSLRKFGNLTVEDVDKVISLTKREVLTSDQQKEIEKGASDLFKEYVENFNSPEIQEALSKIHVFAPIENLSWELTEKNIRLIDSQNKTRVANGKPAATYILSPEQWLRIFKHKINDDAIPIYYWCAIDKGHGMAALQKSYEEIMGKSAPSNLKSHVGTMAGSSRQRDQGNNILKRASKIQNPISKDFGLYPYYDVLDTTYIGTDGNDPWADPEREGVVDNIHNVPTQKSLGKIGADDEELKQYTERLKSGKLADDPVRTTEIFNALITLLMGDSSFGQHKYLTFKEGANNIEAVRNAVFTGITTLVSNKVKKEGLIANPANIENYSKMVAVMFCAINHVDGQRALKEWQKINGSNDYKTTYKGRVDGVEGEVDLTKNDDGTFSYNGQPYTDRVREDGFVSKLMHEENNMSNMVDAIQKLITDKIKDDVSNGRTEDKNKVFAKVSESYLRESYCEPEGNSELEELMTNLYYQLKNSNGVSEEAPINEGEDDWFAPECNDSEDPFRLEDGSQDLNDYMNSEPIDFNEEGEESRTLAESKFYDILNRINKLY